MDKSGYKRPASLTSPAIPEDTAAPPPPPLPATDFSKPRLDSYLVVSLNDVSGDDSVRKERREKERERKEKNISLSLLLSLFMYSQILVVHHLVKIRKSSQFLQQPLQL